MCAECDPPRKCINPPSDGSEMFVETEKCPKCDGAGEVNGEFCRECLGRGYWTLRCCPYKAIPPATWDVLRYAHLADKGSWPVRGGVLDQAQSALDAFGLIDTYIAQVRDERDKRQQRK